MGRKITIAKDNSNSNLPTLYISNVDTLDNIYIPVLILNAEGKLKEYLLPLTELETVNLKLGFVQS